MAGQVTPPNSYWFGHYPAPRAATVLRTRAQTAPGRAGPAGAEWSHGGAPQRATSPCPLSLAPSGLSLSLSCSLVACGRWRPHPYRGRWPRSGGAKSRPRGASPSGAVGEYREHREHRQERSFSIFARCEKQPWTQLHAALSNFLPCSISNPMHAAVMNLVSDSGGHSWIYLLTCSSLVTFVL